MYYCIFTYLDNAAIPLSLEPKAIKKYDFYTCTHARCTVGTCKHND